MRDLLAHETFLSDNYVVLDFEIAVNDEGHGSPVNEVNHMLLACWKRGPGHPAFVPYASNVVYSQWGNEYEQSEVLDAIEQADFFIAHHAKYECGWLIRAGMHYEDMTCFCTLLGEYVRLGNRAAGGEGMAPMSLSLDACTRRRGGRPKDPVVDLLIKNGISPERIPQQWLEQRCRQDVSTTEQLFLSLRRTLRASGRLPVLWTRCLITPNLAKIETEGMFVDGPRVEEAHAQYSARLVVLMEQMREMTGGINPRSSKQVAEFVYDVLKFKEKTDQNGNPKRTPGGARLTRQSDLDSLVATNKRQREFVSLRKEISQVSSAISKALDFLLGVSREMDGRFVGQFNQAATATHRLSSSGVPVAFEMFKGKEKTTQFQNLPRVFKRLFVAGK